MKRWGLMKRVVMLLVIALCVGLVHDIGYANAEGIDVSLFDSLNAYSCDKSRQRKSEFVLGEDIYIRADYNKNGIYPDWIAEDEFPATISINGKDITSFVYFGESAECCSSYLKIQRVSESYAANSIGWNIRNYITKAGEYDIWVSAPDNSSLSTRVGISVIERSSSPSTAPTQSAKPTASPTETPTTTVKPSATPKLSASPSPSPKIGKEPSTATLSGWSEADGDLYGYENEKYRTSPVYITSDKYTAYIMVDFDSSISSDVAKTYKYTWYKKLGNGSYSHVSSLDNFRRVKFTDPTLKTSVSYYCVVSSPDGSWTKKTDVFTIKRSYKLIFLSDEGKSTPKYKPYDESFTIPYGPGEKEDTSFIGWKFNGKVYKPGDSFSENVEAAVFTIASKETTSFKIGWNGNKEKCVAGSDRYIWISFDGNYMDLSSFPLSRFIHEWRIEKNGKAANKSATLYEDGRVHFGEKCGRFKLTLWYNGDDNHKGDYASLEYDVVPAAVKKSSIKVAKKGSTYTVKWGKAKGAERYDVYMKLTNGKENTMHVTKKTSKKKGSLPKKKKKGFAIFQAPVKLKTLVITPYGGGFKGKSTKKKM